MLMKILLQNAFRTNLEKHYVSHCTMFVQYIMNPMQFIIESIYYVLKFKLKTKLIYLVFQI